MRIWLALARASIRWFRDRSGAVDEFEDVVPVAVTMGGESTHQRATFKTKCANSPVPQLEVEQYRGCWTVGDRVCRGFLPFSSSRDTPPNRSKPHDANVFFGRCAKAGAPQPMDICCSSCAILSAAAGRGSSRCRRRRGCADIEQVARVRGRLHAAHSDDRNRHARGDGRDLGQRDRPHCRAGEAAAASAEPRARHGREAPSGGERHCAQRVDQRHARRRRRPVPRARRRRRRRCWASA